MPIGEEYGGATYFMLETHYDNPSKDKDLVDTSGMSTCIQVLLSLSRLSIGPNNNTDVSCSKLIFQV